jgi:DNA polymerase-3 subunit chi
MGMEASFYQTTEGNVVAATVRLLEKIYASGNRCLFYSPLEERVKMIDKTLWTFSNNAFIPHGDKSFGFQDRQPIYLATDIGNPNNATVLVLVDTFDYKNWNSNFEKVIFIFEGQSNIELAKVVSDDLQKNQENVNYWEQSAGGWKRVA